MPNRKCPKGSDIYELVKYEFYHTIDNSGPSIANKLGISIDFVYHILRKIHKDDICHEPIIKPTPYSTEKWKKKEKERLIKELKKYNQSVPEELKVPI